MAARVDWQWICHNSTPMKTSFFDTKRLVRVAIRLRRVSDLIRRGRAGLSDCFLIEVLKSGVAWKRCATDCEVAVAPCGCTFYNNLTRHRLARASRDSQPSKRWLNILTSAQNTKRHFYKSKLRLF